MFTSGTIDGLQGVIHSMEEGTLSVPPPPEDVAEWPLVGKSIFDIWDLAATNLEASILKMKPQIREYAPKLFSAVAGLGTTVLQFILSIIIAGALLVSAKSGAKAAGGLFKILVGDDGEAFTNLAEGTIRSVVQGVLGVAVIQAILSGIGMFAVGMPGTGIWVLLVLMLAIMQLPPILVLLPVSIYVFTIVDTTPAVIFLIYAIIVSMSDAFLKPMFLGRGVDVPMLVILLGAIGGMLVSGIIGLFVGAVVLAITYKVFGALIMKNNPTPDYA
jgi:predicted PurR-regulated permease PerM